MKQEDRERLIEKISERLEELSDRDLQMMYRLVGYAKDWK